MKKIFILPGFILFFLLYAQPGGNSSFAWILKGVVKDSLTKKPIEYCMISIFSMRDSSLITGGVTNENGQFSITVPRPGKFRVVLSFLGYATKTVAPVQFLPDNSTVEPVLDLGIVYIFPASYQLKGVTIESEKPQIELQLDKKVVNVGEDITVQGGTALDVLKNVPGVEVDQDGNISLRGSENVLVLIDGRPSTLTGANRRAALEQIQSSNIERVELLTNPSAKYNPEGMTGIINIVLKKRKGSGLNSMLTAGVGTRNKYNASLGLNYSTDKYTVFTNLDGSSRQSIHLGNIERTSYQWVDKYYLFQRSRGSDVMQNYSLRLGGEYYFPKKWTIAATVTSFFNQSTGKDKTLSFYQNPSGDTTQEFTNIENNARNGFNVEMTVNVTKKFSRPQEELTADFSLSTNRFNDTSFYRMFFFEDNVIESYLTDWQLYHRSTRHQVANSKINWSYLLRDSVLLETGFEGSLRFLNFGNENYLFDFSQGNWIENDTMFYTFLFEEQIGAIYSVIKKQWKKWSASGGLRFERAQTNAHLADSADHINSYFSIYPSGGVSYMINKDNQLQFTYSRRVNRPSFFSLNPFRDYSGYPNIRMGNPYLKPEYIHSAELTYAWYGKKYSFMPALFYKHITDVMSRYRQSINDTVFIMTWQNYQSAISTGIDVTFWGKPVKWWNFNISGQYYWTHINGQNIETSITGNAQGWSLKTNHTFKLPYKLDLQLTGMYNGPRFTGQATRQPFWAVNAAVRKSLLKDKMVISLNVMDVFMSQEFRIIFDQPTYYAVNKHKHESPVAMLNFTWKLKGDYKQRERKRKDIDMQNNDMDF